MVCVAVLASCNEKPTDIGSQLVPGTDTIYAESTNSAELLIAKGTVTQREPIYNSAYVLFGKTADSEGRLFVQFIQWPDVGHPDSVQVISSELVLLPQTYIFGDTADRTLSLAAYELQQEWSANATWDSIWTSDGSTTYYSTAQPTVAQFTAQIGDDDSVIYVPFDLAATKNWLNTAYDSSTADQLYGLVVLPTNNASIRQFRNLDGLSQVLRLRLVTRRNDTASLDTNFVEAAVACFVDTPPAPEGETIVQGARIHRMQYEIRIDSLPEFAIIAGSRFVIRLDNNRSNVGTYGSDEVLSLTYTAKDGSNTTLVTRRDETGVYEFPDMVRVLQRIRQDGGIGTIELSPTDLYYTWRMNRLQFHAPTEDPSVRPYLNVIYIVPEIFN